MQVDISSHATLGGEDYKLKPFNKPNEEQLRIKAPQLENDLNSGEIDRQEYYRRFFDLIFEDGAPEDLDYDMLDGREAEAAIMLFLPPSIRAYALLTGSLQ